MDPRLSSGICPPASESHWATRYIGLPWSATGEGPARGGEGGTPDRDTWKFNCWSFARFVQARHFGRDLPAIPNPEDLLAQARLFRDHPERARWARVDAPQEGDCVLLRQARYPVHVGVWIEVNSGGLPAPGLPPSLEELRRTGRRAGGDGVLHCSRDLGVVFQRIAALELNGWKTAGCYRFRDQVSGIRDQGSGIRDR